MGKRTALNAPGSHFHLAPVAAALALLFGAPAHADWKFTPSVALTQTYTDNVGLEPRERAQGQFVTDLAPGFSIINNGPRLKLAALYQHHLFAYAGREPRNTESASRQLAASAKASLIDDFLYFDGAASRGAQGVSAFGPPAAGNLYSSVNRTEVSTYSASPYLRHRFGASADLTLRYTLDSVATDARGLGDSKGETVALQIASGQLYQKVGWGVNYRREDLDNSLYGKTLSESSSLDLRYRVSPYLSLLANGGYDSYDYNSLGGRTAGSSWSAGFHWTPSRRTSLQATAGHRFFGQTWTLAASHRSRRSVWSINYNDDVTTSRAQFLLPAAIDTAAMIDQLFSATIADPVARQQAVAAYILATGLPPSLAENINYLSNRFMRQKHLQASSAFKSARSSMVLTVYASRRVALSTQASDSELLGSSLSSLNDNVDQTGASALFSYRFTPRATANLSLNASRSESRSTGTSSDQQLVRLGMTRQFGSRLRGALELRHNRGGSAMLDGRKYHENAISATISMQL